MQIYARQENGGYVLTDDSYTIHDLGSSGCNLNTEKRRDLLKMTLNGFGVKLNSEALEVHATAGNFPLHKHNLLQAMLAVNDLFYLAKPVVESLFYEDVVTWLDANDIRYTPKVKFTGTSGYDHLFVCLSRSLESSRSVSCRRSTAPLATQQSYLSLLGLIPGKCALRIKGVRCPE